MVVVATWPVLLRLQAILWNRRALAVMVMTMLLLLLFLVPLALAIGTIVQNSDQIVEWTKSIATFHIPAPPDWVASLPFVGHQAATAWQQAAESGGKELMEKLAPHAGAMAKWATSKFGSIGLLFVQFVLTVIIAAVMYAGGESAAAAVKRFARRLAGPRGESTVELAGQAIRGVALGVGVTALVQSALGGIGLAIAGIPFAGLLTAVMFMLCIAQTGAGPGVASRSDLGLLERRHRLGHLPADLVHHRRHAGQFPAPDADQAGSRSSAAADLCRRHRRPVRFRAGRHLRRPGHARCQLTSCWVNGSATKTSPVPNFGRIRKGDKIAIGYAAAVWCKQFPQTFQFLQ